MQAPQEVQKLVEKFQTEESRFRDPNYNETQVRIEFIDPLFTALGWDMRDSRTVVHEDRVKVTEDSGKKASKHPDYGFRVAGEIRPRFYVEAKKPAVNIAKDPEPAYQVRRYGWSAGMPLCILTDFEEFSIYDCRVKPEKTDSAKKALRQHIKYSDYLERWDELYELLNPEAVLEGSLNKYIDDKPASGTLRVDEAFLQEMEGWRTTLAKEIALHNPNLTRRELNIAVQRTIDRIVFLRICEARKIEPDGRMRSSTANRKDIYEELKILYREADDKYNSGLFNFTKDGDTISLAISISDEPLQNIIRRLYYPESPYEFSVLPADILGQVYERFLGKVIELDTGGKAEVVEKPEVRKAGGVYYTPTYIVDYIVENTVGKLLNPALTPNPSPKGRGALKTDAPLHAPTDDALTLNPLPKALGRGL